MTAAQRAKNPRGVLALFAIAWTALWITLGSLSDWGSYWIAWAIFGLLIPELYGVFFYTAGTLSDNVWAAEHLDLTHPLDFAEWTPLHWAIAVLVWLLFAWLSVHLPFGWLR